MPPPLTLAAHHEAARAVVLYRVTGAVDGPTSIAAAKQEAWLGGSSAGISDCFGSRARILSCYAGDHAARRIGGSHSQQNEQDEANAALELRRWRWEAEEQALRDEARDLVERHWNEIVAVAEDLVRMSTLDEVEVATLASIAAGVSGVSRADLDRYRALKGTT
jgi:hypothetical protein